MDLYKKLLVIIFIFIILFLAMELFTRFFVIQSDSFNFTLASKLWYKKYWKPVNSLGYRDIEHTAPSLMGKKVIFVVGDSFVAGAGIKNYKDRFSNLLQDKLGKNWVVINIAHCGWATEKEYKAILSHPYKPDIIILCYTFNDIEDAARKIGVKMKLPINPPPRIIKSFISTSYLFNYFYWRYIRYIRPESIIQTYCENIQNYFLDEMVWQEHKGELLNIINYAKIRNIELIIVLIPLPSRIEFSKKIMSKAAGFMELNKISVISLIDKFRGRDYRDLIVSLTDGHFNVKANREIADILFDRVYKADTNKRY